MKLALKALDALRDGIYCISLPKVCLWNDNRHGTTLVGEVKIPYRLHYVAIRDITEEWKIEFLGIVDGKFSDENAKVELDDIIKVDGRYRKIWRLKKDHIASFIQLCWEH